MSSDETSVDQSNPYASPQGPTVVNGSPPLSEYAITFLASAIITAEASLVMVDVVVHRAKIAWTPPTMSLLLFLVITTFTGYYVIWSNMPSRYRSEE
jgi:hypothetical protein